MVLLVAALSVLLVPAFFGCRETLPPAPVPDLSPNLDQLPLRPPSGGEPFLIIDTPAPPANPSAVVMLGPVIQFGWHSGLEVEPLFVRWLCMQVVDTNGTYNPSFDIVRDLNLHPERYENKWVKWVPYKNPHGRTTMIGEDEPLALRRSHIFAVQAQDRSDKVTTVFTRGVNIRQFIVSNTAAPLLNTWEPFLGGSAFIGTNLRLEAVTFP